MNCPIPWDRTHALHVAHHWPDAAVTTKLLILDALKAAVCGESGCAMRCDFGQDVLVAAARAAGEIP